MSTVNTKEEPKIPTTDDTAVKEEKKESIADSKVPSEMEDSENEQTDHDEDDFKKSTEENESEDIDNRKSTKGKSTIRPTTVKGKSTNKPPSKTSQLSDEGQSVRKLSAKDQSFISPSSEKKSAFKGLKSKLTFKKPSTTSQLSKSMVKGQSNIKASPKDSSMTRPSTRKTTKKSKITLSRESSFTGNKESVEGSERRTQQSLGSRGASDTKSTVKSSQGSYQKTTVDGGSRKSSLKNSMGSKTVDNYEDDEIEEYDYLNNGEDGDYFYGDEGDGDELEEEEDNESSIMYDPGSGIQFDDGLIESKSDSKIAGRQILRLCRNYLGPTLDVTIVHLSEIISKKFGKNSKVNYEDMENNNPQTKEYEPETSQTALSKSGSLTSSQSEGKLKSEASRLGSGSKGSKFKQSELANSTL